MQSIVSALLITDSLSQHIKKICDYEKVIFKMQIRF